MDALYLGHLNRGGGPDEHLAKRARGWVDDGDASDLDADEAGSGGVGRGGGGGTPPLYEGVASHAPTARPTTAGGSEGLGGGVSKRRRGSLRPLHEQEKEEGVAGGGAPLSPGGGGGVGGAADEAHAPEDDDDDDDDDDAARPAPGDEDEDRVEPGETAKVKAVVREALLAPLLEAWHGPGAAAAVGGVGGVGGFGGAAASAAAGARGGGNGAQPTTHNVVPAPLPPPQEQGEIAHCAANLGAALDALRNAVSAGDAGAGAARARALGSARRAHERLQALRRHLEQHARRFEGLGPVGGGAGHGGFGGFGGGGGCGGGGGGGCGNE